MDSCKNKKGPDFLGIGSMRSGTSWLYQTLRKHPEVWLPPLKELRYFDGYRPEFFFQYHLRRRLESVARDGYNDDSELTWDLKFFCEERTDQWYLSLFDSAEGRIAGEITPDYCILPDITIKRIRDLLPHLKLILILRNPVDRAWSHLVKDFAMDKGIHADALRKDVLWNVLGRDEVEKRNNYPAILDKWQRYFPKEQIFIGFYDEINENPANFTHKVLSFLGIRDVDSFIEKEMKNLKRKVFSTESYNSGMPHEIRKELSRLNIHIIEELSKRLIGPPQRWFEECKTILGE